MANPKISLFSRLSLWVTGLPKLVLVAAASAVLATAAAGGVFLYRTYNYVQHDNDFCLSCHLMQDPYQRFARSAHRGLGCKACHQPTFIARSRMALTQIIEQPAELTAHAEVPNDKCAECHVRGDPAKWELIRSSAGHRIHLESKDPSLKGLQCVQCHSTSLHEFAAVDKTCGQAGCHEDVRVRLGKMGQLTIHCAACHSFNAPVAENTPAESLSVALRPERQECLSCHAMRVLVSDFPADDPHKGSCGSCHNPHTQTAPAQAVQSCTNAGCHAQPDTLTPFHRGLDTGVIDNCITCHKAHDFRLDGQNCLGCHSNIFSVAAAQPAPGRVGLATVPDLRGRQAQGASSRAHTAPAAVRPGQGATFRFAALVLHPEGAPPAAPVRGAATPVPVGSGVPTQQPQGGMLADSVRFRHALHRSVACTACHNSGETHGAVTVTSLWDCRSCHHTPPVSQTCTTCHKPGEYGTQPHPERQTMKFSVAQRATTRTLAFRHQPHQGVACTRCHTEQLTLSAAGISCDGCHEQHHQPENDCMVCHRPVPEGTHPLSVHTSCAGAGCHEPAPFTEIPRTRNFCLSCHQDRVDHRPGRNCSDCHVLPEAKAARPAGQGR